MGTTSEKLTYLNTTKTLIKEELNLGGANISTEPFRAYSSKLKGIYKDYLANGTDTLWNNWEKVNGTGETLSLTPTIKGKMKVDLKGNTHQETNLYTGIIEQGGFDSSGQPSTTAETNRIRTKDYIQVVPSTTIPITFSGVNNRYAYFYGQDKSYISRNGWFGSGIDIEIPSNAYYMKLMFRKSNNTDITPSSLTSLQVGASPNPDYPQDIQVVSGDNTIKVEGKNLFDKSTASLNQRINGNDGTLGGYVNIFASDYINVYGASNITIQGLLNYSNVGGSTQLYAFYDRNKTYISGSASGNNNNTLTISVPNNAYYIRFNGLMANIDNIQLELGNQSSAYTPYVSQTYPISLGNIELCKIGTYQDKIFKNTPNTTDYDSNLEDNVWYLKKEIGIDIPNSSNNWYKNADSPDGNYISFFKYSPFIATIPVYCNYFIYGMWATIQNQNENYIWNASSSCGFRIHKDNLTGYSSSMTNNEKINLFKTWLDNNNVSVYYVLSTPTYETITDTTLISQLEALAYSYEGTTNISQVNDDMAFVLDITALKEMS